MAVTRRDDCVGIDERDRAGGEARNARLRVLGDDHADAAHDLVADVQRIRDFGRVVPVRRRRAEPERIVVRLRIGRINVEGIAVGGAVMKAGRVRHRSVAFSPAELVQLNAAVGRAAFDVGDLNASAGGVDVDGPGPEFGTVGCGERVRGVAELVPGADRPA